MKINKEQREITLVNFPAADTCIWLAETTLEELINACYELPPLLKTFVHLRTRLNRVC